MFKWNFYGKFKFYLQSSEDLEVPFSDWKIYQQEYFSQISIIIEFIDNGLAKVNESSVEIATEDILSLNEIDKLLLGLPADYPFVIYIETDGILGLNAPKFTFRFFDFVPNGNQMRLVKEGALLKKDGEIQYLLSLNQYKVLQTITDYNSLPDNNRDLLSSLSCLADIKKYSDGLSTHLNDTLNSQNVLRPEKIKIDASFHDAVLELKPKIDNLNQESLLKAFDRKEEIKSTYNVIDEDKITTRVIIDNTQKEELAKLKRNRKIENGETIADIVENPENYFDENIIDLSFFSQRVREIGIYKPKFYPFVCPYKSEWIPGIVIKDKINGEKKIYFKTVNDLDEFKSELDRAQEEGESHFTYKNEQVSIEDGVKIVSNACNQFKSPEKPVVREDADDVLIIKENAVFLEYIENNINPNLIQQQDELSEIDNLVDMIQLKDHQNQGIAWLQSLFQKELSGCLLADDMGLGKTLQLLYFIEWHAQKIDSDKPYLIVAPVSLLENWESEYFRFFHPLTLKIVLLDRDMEMDRDFSEDIISSLQAKQIILTNYESLRAYQMNLCAVDYSIVVLDEAQRIKTPGTLVTNVSKALKADFKIAMTGTPVENTLVDLWCIMDFSVPGLLGNAKDFAREYQNPLRNENTDIRDLGENLRSQIGVFIKRRLKQEVADDLPKKNLEKIYRIMPEIQAKRYADEIEIARSEQIEGVEKRNQILKSLWAIRDISDHPFLVDKQINSYSSPDLIASSSKLQIIVEVIKEIESKSEKVIIFADRKGTQKMLQKVIFESFNISPPSIINGDTPSSKQKATLSKLSRQQTIDRFQSKDGFNVIIMSQLAAGVGLNVVGANHVIHYTRHWNPAKEDQATDRVYRIGQTKDVTVYFPMAVFPDNFQDENGERLKSFDEIINDLLSKKKLLASSTLFPSEQAEVHLDEIYCEVFENTLIINNNVPLSILEIEKLTPKLFEAYVASLYTNQGFTVHLTPFSNDKGADVVALGEDCNYLIQVKQSQSSTGLAAIQEIVASKKYYENSYGIEFSLVVVTNNIFNDNAREFAALNYVTIIDGQDFIDNCNNFQVTIQDIYRHEAQRMSKI